jgi:hypothetical protein
MTSLRKLNIAGNDIHIINKTSFSMSLLNSLETFDQFWARWSSFIFGKKWKISICLESLWIFLSKRYLFPLNLNFCKDELLNALLFMYLSCGRLHNDNVFNYLTNLGKINLHSTYISLVPEVLNTLPHLNSIILQGNKIDRWNASTFENMTLTIW